MPTDIRSLTMGLLELILFSVCAQETDNQYYAFKLVPSYTFYGSIDKIHSPYRYDGKDFGISIEGTIFRSTKFHSLTLSYESLMRYPTNLPIQENITLESYDNSRGTYLWPTTPSFLKKQTYLFHQNFSGHYLLPLHLFSGKWFLGYRQELTVVNCPNLPMLELFSVSLGPVGYCHIPLTQHITYELSLSMSLISLDIRNSYATVDGNVGEERKISYYYEYVSRHARINSVWNHSLFYMQHGFLYRFKQNIAIQTGYLVVYRRLETPRQLKSMIISYQLGIQYAW